MTRTILVLTLSLSLMAACADAQLFGTDPFGGLVTVNPATGAAMPVGPSLLNLPITELEATPGGLIATTGGGTSTVVSFNPMTGAATVLSMYSLGAINGLAHDGVSTLYGTFIPGPGGPCSLVTLDPTTGLTTMIGPTGILGSIGGLAFDPSSGVLLGVTSGSSAPLLLTINTATGMASPVGMIVSAPGVSFSSLEFDSTGTLLAGGYDGVLYSISLMTLMATPVGPHGPGAFKLSGLAEVGGPPILPNCPGTGEDLITFVSKNGSPPVAVGGGTDVLTVATGDLVQLTHASPGGTFVGVGDFIVLGSTIPTGGAIGAIFPGIWLNPATAFVIAPTVAGAPITLGPAGFTYAFIYSGATPGISVVIQGFVLTMTAANGIFASTDGLDMQLM